MERMQTRRQQRIWTLQALFEIDFCEIDANEAIANLEERESDAIHAQYTHELITLVYNHLKEIDHEIEKYSKEWRLERMPKVDLCILRMATAEMLFINDVTDGVAINEAIELAKEFSTPKSSKFINGILGALSHSRIDTRGGNS